jgi:hypothetical protein
MSKSIARNMWSSQGTINYPILLHLVGHFRILNIPYHLYPFSVHVVNYNLWYQLYDNKLVHIVGIINYNTIPYFILLNVRYSLKLNVSSYLVRVLFKNVAATWRITSQSSNQRSTYKNTKYKPQTCGITTQRTTKRCDHHNSVQQGRLRICKTRKKWI